MDEQRKLVKSLTLKHKRESKFKESLKNKTSKVMKKAFTPIKLGRKEMKNFTIDYEFSSDSTDDIPASEDSLKAKPMHSSHAMLEKLKEVFKL